MVIYYGNSIEEILKKNLDIPDNLDNKLKQELEQGIIGVGIDVIVKPFNSEKPFFYKSNIRYLSKADLHSFVGDWHKQDEYFDRYKAATRANVNIVMEKFQEETKNNKLVSVLENDWYTKKLINPDIIQEVQGFVFDPRERKFR